MFSAAAFSQTSFTPTAWLFDEVAPGDVRPEQGAHAALRARRKVVRYLPRPEADDEEDELVSLMLLGVFNP